MRTNKKTKATRNIGKGNSSTDKIPKNKRNLFRLENA